MKNDLNMDELKRIDPETLDRLDAVMDDLQGAMPAAELKELLGRSLRFGAAHVITFTLFHFFSDMRVGYAVSDLKITTSGV